MAVPDRGLGLTSGIESTEELREALFALRRQNELLGQGSAQAQTLLDALESLLAVSGGEDAFGQVFTILHKVFSYSSALMLAEHEAAPAPAGDAGPDAAEAAPHAAANRLECIVADPTLLQGSLWPADGLFSKVMGGKVIATFSNASSSEWLQMAAGTGEQSAWVRDAIEQSALHLPVRAGERRGVLILLRARGSAGFGRPDVALAQRFSLLVSHALASRFARQSEAESRHLRELTNQLRSSEQATRRNAQLLQTLMSVLPVGVAVQDASGSLVLVNDAIAPMLGGRVQAEGRMPSTPLPFDLSGGPQSEARRRRHDFLEHLASGRQRSVEFTLRHRGEDRTLLITGKPVHILDEPMLVSTALDITARKQLEQDLSRRAYHDALTGLPNRVLMQEIVAKALRRHADGGMFALAFIDLDNFKQVNDYYGHALGDALLKAVAQRVVQSIRSADTLARISGDEFLLLIDPLDDARDLPPLINRVVEVLKQPFMIEGRELLTSASLGASIHPLHGNSFEALCRCADGAMYRAKRDRKGSVSYFDENVDAAQTERMEAEQRLRLAIRERRFRVAFQPKFSLHDRQVVGLEALARWVDPDGTVHQPGSFIELASELGLLDAITEAVLEQVAEHLPALQRRFGNAIFVSLNLSARQASDLAFMARFTERIEALGVARQLMIELTEDALLQTQTFEREVLPRLRAAGMRLSIDDFGTGYSSLAMLADMTVDEVKVDRSLIRSIHERPRNQGVLRAIESLCAGLGTPLVAEGVETEAELEYLCRHTRISVVQGFHFAKPGFIDAILLEDAASRRPPAAPLSLPPAASVALAAVETPLPAPLPNA